MIDSKIGIHFLAFLALGSCTAGPGLARAGPDTAAGYRDCGISDVTSADATVIKSEIAKTFWPWVAPTAIDQFFADNTAVVAPADFRKGWRDLIVYISGPSICGSSGCNAYVFELWKAGGESGHSMVTKILPARLPISVLPAVHHRWHDIGVKVAGGGIANSYIGALSYDGKSYDSNPTLSNIRHVKKGVGEVVLGPPGASPKQCRLR